MRYLPQTQQARKEMMDAIGVKNVDELFRDIPKSAFIDGLAALPKFKGELEVERIMGAYANQNHAASQGPFFLGAGTYFHHIPASVDYVIQRSEFLTAYTPYQPEIAQGTLQVIYEYQTFIAQLTGQEVANASMYDGATATAEAALMAMRVTKRNKIAIGTALHPHYKQVVQSYLNNIGAELIDLCPLDDGASATTVAEDKLAGVACVIVQSPDFFGTPHAYEDFRKQCDDAGALLVVVINEILSLGLCPAPEIADIVCGEAQSVGVAMSFGGPHLGFFACREKFIRQMPGRLCGETVDAKGRKGYVLTLSTREQHIRREKATSNICTNQGLCALAFTVHMTLFGEDGFKTLARINHETACDLADALSNVKGVSVENDAFFNEFIVTLPKAANDVVNALADQGIIAGYPVEGNRLLVTATEMTTEEDIRAFAKALTEALA
jgi:glycine dehydrogenase subunit 1